MHTYTAQDFERLDPDALKALEIIRVKADDYTPMVRLLFADALEGVVLVEMPRDTAAALLIGMVAGRCDAFHVWRETKDYSAQVNRYVSGDGAQHRKRGPSPLAAALAAYGEMVRSEKGAGDAH